MPSAPARAPRLTAAQRREQILDVTQRIVGERGFHGVTIDGVARAAGITRPVVYGHFEDLGGLLAALIEREGDRAQEQLASFLPAPGAEGDPTELLLGALEGFLEAVRDEPVRWRLVLMPPEGAPELLHEAIARDRAAVTMQLAGVTAGALGRGGTAGSPDPELTALLLQTFSEEAARLLLQDPERYPIDRLLAHARWALATFAAGAG